jgi:hypothetical protein
MKNFKQIAFGLLVGTMALGFSAFTNAPQKAKFATRFWVNDGSGNYVLLSGTPDLANCEGTSTVDCAVEATDGTIPSSFPVNNPSHYSISADPGSTKAIYQP